MVTPELQKFVQESLAKGQTPEQIKIALRQCGGWTESDLDEVFKNTLKPVKKKSILYIVILLLILFLSGMGIFGISVIFAFGGVSPVWLLLPTAGIISFFGLLSMKRWGLYLLTIPILILIGWLILGDTNKTLVLYLLIGVLVFALIYFWLLYKKLD
jgi:hypothetical protein